MSPSSFIHSMNHDIAILYGSQTGNAEDLAKRFGCMAKARGFSVLVQAIDDFQLKCLTKERMVIFICSTTGHGQEPENMKDFYNFMRRRDLPKKCLSNLKFAVYGLGDSSYAKFNYVAKILFKRIRDCGAEPIQDLVIADEQHPLGIDGETYPKLAELWPRLDADMKSISRVLKAQDKDQTLPESSYEVQLYNLGDIQVPDVKFTDEFVDKYEIKDALCIANQRVTSDSHFQDTRYLSFKVIDNVEWEPGDVCSIMPVNSDENVKLFLETLGLNPDHQFSITKRDHKFLVNYLYDFIPDGLKINDLVKYYFDIQSVPHRSFFEYLWPFSNDELEREKLKEFASTEGQEEMYEYCKLPKRSILETLLDFPNTLKRIPFQYLFDLIPPIKARSFSIASAASQHPKEIHLIVGIVNYKTRMRKTRQGLCSTYLSRMISIFDRDGLNSPGDRSLLKFSIRHSSFKLPKDSSKPILMIGPGLGIAPMKSFIEERSREGQKSGANYFYFGCRYANSDYYFKELLEQQAAAGHLHLRVAFSREEPKNYVQDLLKEDSGLIRRLILDSEAYVYIAGNSKLPEGVRDVLRKILLKSETDIATGVDDDSKLIEVLEAQGRIQYDCW